MKRLRDDDRILRDIEKIPEQRRREGLMAIRERELGLASLSGDTAVVKAAREARCRVLEELTANWEQKYADRAAVMKPNLLDALKRKDAAFWFQHRDSAPEEAFLSELFELEPIADDSPMTAEARQTRCRIMSELSANSEQMYAYQEGVMKPGLLDAFKRKDAAFWLQHRDSTPEEALLPELKEGRMAIREQELHLAPLSGEAATFASARETRCRILEALSADWKQKYDNQAAVMKPGLLDAFKRKDAAFWFQHRDSAPEEAFLSELFELEPIEGDSPLMADARSARHRVLGELLGLQLKEKEAVNLEAAAMAGRILAQESPQFWYEHMSFSADELIKLYFPDIQNWQTSSERKTYAAYGITLLSLSAMILYFFIALYRADSAEVVEWLCAFFLGGGVYGGSRCVLFY